MEILTSILTLGGIGAIGSVALNRIAKKFHVDEDERIAQVEALLPGANCGGCGRKGCHDFAVQSVEANSLDGLFCPVGGRECMKAIAKTLGCEPADVMPNIAVVRCGGTNETKTPLKAKYEGPRSCAIMNLTAGDYECANSCLGCGDCMKVCRWGAIKVYPGVDKPVVDADKCTGCGVCVTHCPRFILELRPKGIKNRRVWVACSNCQKGALTRQQCKVGCIACGKCVKTCQFGAIEIKNNHAYIDPAKCKTCGKCVTVCPTKAIHCANIVIKPKDETANV